jgi:glycosyltransferase involved in cell wall biosynthesis
VRVLLTAHAFLPRSLAGVEVYTARLARALQALGHEVLVLAAAHDLSAPAYAVSRRRLGRLEVVEIANAHLEGTLEATYHAPALDRALGGILDGFRPDCVHAQHLLNLSTGLFDAAREVGAPLVLTLHDYWLSCPRDGLRMRADGALCAVVDHRVCAQCLSESPHLVAPLQRGATHAARRAGLGGALHALHRRAPRLTTGAMRLMRRMSPVRTEDLGRALDTRAAHLRDRVREAAALLAPTQFARDRAVEWGVPPAQIRVMPLGAVEGPTRPRPPGPRRRLGYVGTMAPHKGVHVLLEAVRGLAGGDWTLDLVGNTDLDPAYGARLRALAGRDPRIRFRGAIGPEAQGPLWESLDALVVPSLWWENSPLAVLEALSAGVAVVASRTGGVPEVLPEAAGVLVPPGDLGALRTALEGLIEGRLLAGALEALPLKTSVEGARELAALYATLWSRGRGAEA